MPPCARKHESRALSRSKGALPQAALQLPKLQLAPAHHGGFPGVHGVLHGHKQRPQRAEGHVHRAHGACSTAGHSGVVFRQTALQERSTAELPLARPTRVSEG